VAGLGRLALNSAEKLKNTRTEEEDMELIFFVALVAGLGFWIYYQGKRLGSRKAYGIGRWHGRSGRF